MKMLCLRWLLMAAVVVVACVCVPGSESVCWNSSLCNNLSNEQRIKDCIRPCVPKIQEELQQLNTLAQKINADNDLVLSVLLAILSPSEDKGSEAGAKSHGGKRRSYSMEHFRWGKPPGRKRRPVKVFASSLEGGGLDEGDAKRDLRSETQQNPVLQRERAKAQAPLSPQDRKASTYRMSHFRWGNPLTSKRDGSSSSKQLGEKTKGRLARLLRNIIWDLWRRTAQVN